MWVKLDGCFRHVIILIQVCKPDNCTWKQLIGQIFISFPCTDIWGNQQNSLWTHALYIFYLHQDQTDLRFCIPLWVPIQTLFEVKRPYRFQCPWPVPLLTTPSSFHAAPREHGFAALFLQPRIPLGLFCRFGFCGAPHSGTFKTCAQRQREERKCRMCLSGFIKWIFIIIFLEVAVNIDRWGKEHVCICTIRYRNISTGILLYSQFPYP